MLTSNPRWTRRFIKLSIQVSTKQMHGAFLRTIIIMLYIFSTIMFMMDWAFMCRAFIEYGYNYCSLYIALLGKGRWWRICSLINGITSGMSTLLIDVTIVHQPIWSCQLRTTDILQIWCCWVLWDYQWQIVLLPIICAIATSSESCYLSFHMPCVKYFSHEDYANQVSPRFHT